MREDPVRRGLLYAATEQAVYVSFDDGESWQSLRLNMPATSIRDLVIKEDDLVVGTHGRSFWILDDVTPLRQIAPASVQEAAHLFRPQEAWRFRWNKWTDTPLPQEEPAGQNPPDGAIVHYFLREPATGPVTLEIVDSSGAVARRYTSNDPPEAPAEGRNIPDYWIRPPQVLSSAGEYTASCGICTTPRPRRRSSRTRSPPFTPTRPRSRAAPWPSPAATRCASPPTARP